MMNTDNIKLYKSTEHNFDWHGFIKSFYNSVNFSINYTFLNRDDYNISLYPDGYSYVFNKKDGFMSGIWFTLDDSVVVII